MYILIGITFSVENLLLKFKSGLQEHMYRELKYVDINSIDAIDNQDHLVEEKFYKKWRPQQCSSSYLNKHNSVPTKSSSIVTNHNSSSFTHYSSFLWQ